MANENEDIKKEGTENSTQSGENPHKHETLIDEIVEKIEEGIDSIDGDFPLSGGDEPHHVHPKTASEIEEEKQKEDAHKAFLKQELNDEFPLSGGEQ